MFRNRDLVRDPVCDRVRVRFRIHVCVRARDHVPDRDRDNKIAVVMSNSHQYSSAL